MSPFYTILSHFRKYAHSERDKGDRFERLIQAYLQTDPRYADLFTNVWLWNDFFARKDFGGKDTGIDLVARTTSGDFWAVQCKCFQENAVIDKPAVDSFLSTSSKHFKNEQLQSIGFAHRLWISTTNHWGENAETTIRNQHPLVTRLGLHDLENAPVDWEKLAEGLSGEASRKAKKIPRPHQIEAVHAAHEHFKTADRGKLIMACGTGKTFTALKIAEKETGGSGLVLFLVPSIALLGQTLGEWSADAERPFNPICICSDSNVSRKRSVNEDSDGYSVVDLALPASTDVQGILRQFDQIQQLKGHPLTVVFSTYQSIEVIAAAQAALNARNNNADHPFAAFDLIVCDEAHRTTGVTLAEEDESAFVKVHNNAFIRARKRLYMTATPRLFSDDSKSKAAQAEAVLCSMDDDAIYGPEIYRIGFGKAVEDGLLSDYKVLILTVSEEDMTAPVQNMVADSSHEINADDASKLIGCINALSKKILGDEGILKDSDPEPMRRAVAFCQNIKISEKTTRTFNGASEVYFNSLSADVRDELVSIQSQHIDGSMNTPTRDEKLAWLKAAPADSRECRILTNVRCLSEGVDVPSLDAVLFLSARNSQVDVVQSVGRVMRRAPGKKYGYIVIPVVVPVEVEPDQALNDNERFKVVWTVLNALRAHDDRFNATVNKIELNKRRPDQILVGRPDILPGDAVEYALKSDADVKEAVSQSDYRTLGERISRQLSMQFQQLQSVLFARMVQKVGDRRYWEQWAKDVAGIAERHIERIKRLTIGEGEHQRAFADFLGGLRRNINPAISEAEAVEMLAQHIITRPVFEALFEGYSFVKNNPISVSMQAMLDVLESRDLGMEKDAETLTKFYESVRTRAAGIDNAEGKQRIIVELYDKFFKTAFPKMVEKLGIVYTPVEVVDFIIHSVEDLLQKEFGRSISDENIHVLDPFTGTGTFITRLLQSDLIRPADLERKYARELHANEIVLLAYYIAAINIENAYHDATPDPDDGIDTDNYTPFEGIVLTDTFQLGETDNPEELFSEKFPQNSARVQAQKRAPLRVILGNPPYSVGQKSANDNAQNQSYPKLDKRVESTYAQGSQATSIKALYDAYIKAFRWSTDRLDTNHGGIIAFVSNGAWLDSNGMDSLRKCLLKEFSAIYVFNLKGNARTSGELRQKEAGNVFGSGSRTPIAITFLVKKPGEINENANIYYHDIGDYLSREEKLGIIQKFASVNGLPFIEIRPNEHGDWISQRDDLFGTWIPIEPVEKFDGNSKSYFLTHSLGLASGRDAWIYNFSKPNLEVTMRLAIDFFNQQSLEFKIGKSQNPKLEVDEFIDTDPTKFSWNRNLKQDLEKFKIHQFNPAGLVVSHYRPFCKSNLYFDKDMNAMLYQTKKLFPTPATQNRVICVSGVGVTKEFSCIISDIIPDLELIGKSQCFPLYYYEARAKAAPSLFEAADEQEHIRRDGVSDWILAQARTRYGGTVTKEDVFYYVYGFLHHPQYRERFSADLKKMLPRLPLVEAPKDFWAFSKAGRLLAELHLHYDDFSRAPSAEAIGVTVRGAESGQFRVEKMRFPSKTDKSVILYNSHIAVEHIPAEAYEYVVNGKSAIEWVMERYQITTHKDSGIRNDPNDWAYEVGNPRYILDLLLSVIRLSVETVEVVKGLPGVNTFPPPTV